MGIGNSNEGILGKRPRTIGRKVGNGRAIRAVLLLILFVNFTYLFMFVIKGRGSREWTDKIRTLASSMMEGMYTSEEQDETFFIPKFTTVYSKKKKSYGKLHPLPNAPYKQLTVQEKIRSKLNEVISNPLKFWLADTDLTDYKVEIDTSEFLPEKWTNNRALFYDPRFTLAIYLNEIRAQLLERNPKNEPSKRQHIVVPFAWSDWVDLTMLNEELSKPELKRKTCEYMKSTHHEPTRVIEYCKNNANINSTDLKLIGLPSTKFIPGFAVKESPTNKATNEVRMLEGKSHLLTFAANPLSIIFMSENGTYEVEVEGKKRVVDGLFTKYLQRNNIGTKKLILDPVDEFNSLLHDVKPMTIEGEDDLWGAASKVKDLNPETSKNIFLPQVAFDYQEDKVEQQIKDFRGRLDGLEEMSKNPLIFNAEQIEKLKLLRKEKEFYDGLLYAHDHKKKDEEPYFRMARLVFPPIKNHDPGWHYEWRFFNGALRYMKKGWTEKELEIREKVLLDRVLRNWFRFTNEKGIVSWISHGVLLSWYWDGLLFPFDKDIDVQMPITELVRFSKMYNQTLVVEDINEGLGKFLIDCSTFLHNRDGTERQNHIDARFIDIDTGSYIDITGLGISDETAPETYNDVIEKAAAANELKPVYNCRNKHFYSYEELVPLRRSMIDGIPCYIPNQIEKILKDEYSVGMERYEYDDYYFIDQLNLWIHALKFVFLFADAHPGIFKGGAVSDPDKLIELVKGINEEQALRILEKNDDILLEYYLTKDITDLHKEELALMFNSNLGAITKLGDFGLQREQEIIDENMAYRKLISEFKLRKPLRKSVFNYERVDKPLHHSEYEQLS